MNNKKAGRRKRQFSTPLCRRITVSHTAILFAPTLLYLIAWIISSISSGILGQVFVLFEYTGGVGKKTFLHRLIIIYLGSLKRGNPPLWITVKTNNNFNFCVGKAQTGGRHHEEKFSNKGNGSSHRPDGRRNGHRQHGSACILKRVHCTEKNNKNNHIK